MRWQTIVVYALAAYLFGVLGCAKASDDLGDGLSSGDQSGVVGSDMPDMGPTDMTEPEDTDPGDMPEDTLSDLSIEDTSIAPFGTLCEKNGDCDSAICVPAEPTNPDSIWLCSRSCLQECPDGWVCKFIAVGADSISACVPSDDTLCKIEPECVYKDNDGNITEQSESCGNCGVRTRQCKSSCRWTPWSNCNGEKQCAPGIEEQEKCGKCGLRTRTCSDECTWSEFTECVGEKTCLPNDKQIEECGTKCGKKVRTCLDSCEWGEFGLCENEGECTPDDIDSQNCNNDPCVQQRRTCDATCKWSDLSECITIAECSNGEDDIKPCGLCDLGSKTRSCIASCAFGSFGECTYKGLQPCTKKYENDCLCKPGDEEVRDCGDKCGNQKRTCTDSCGWSDWSACENEQICVPGIVENRACGNCGTQSRTCIAKGQPGQCTFGLYTECTAESTICKYDADPLKNEKQTIPCGKKCGDQTRVCNNKCDWDPYGDCENEKLCEEGKTEDAACGNCGTYTRTCIKRGEPGQCTWGQYGVCQNESTICKYDADDAKNETQTVACGTKCGTKTRKCLQTCSWDDYGGCENEGICEEGKTKNQSCGNCGTQVSTCIKRGDPGQCTWGPFATCENESTICTYNADPTKNEKQTEDCGTKCGTRTRVCLASCSWDEFSSCGNEGVCEEGKTQTQACGNCGTQTSTCISRNQPGQCTWGSFGSCQSESTTCTYNPDPSLNQKQTVPCGDQCGSRTRVCQSDCTWGAYAPCQDVGVCKEGSTSTRACGNCGTQTRYCIARGQPGQCTWSGYGLCGNESTVCTYDSNPLLNQTQTRDCGNQCGHQTRVCLPTCTWDDYGSCQNIGTCTEGQTQTQACGNCGTRSRTCIPRDQANECTWPTTWGNCTNESQICTYNSNPSLNETQTRSCGDRCGDQTRKCLSTCTWDDYGACENEGACVPNTPASQSCGYGLCGTQYRTCNLTCGWPAWGTCFGDTAGVHENDDNLSQATDLGSFTDSGFTVSGSAYINPSGEQDWFSVHIEDNAGASVNTTITLTGVSGQNLVFHVWRVCRYCNTTPKRLTSSPVTSYYWNGSGSNQDCGCSWDDDSARIYVQVYSTTATSSCSPFTITYHDE